MYKKSLGRYEGFRECGDVGDVGDDGRVAYASWSSCEAHDAESIHSASYRAGGD